MTRNASSLLRLLELNRCVCQVDHAKSLHYVGAGVAFPAGLLFVCLQCVLTYRVAVTALDYWMAHFRVALALGAMVSLVLSILPDEGDSSVLCRDSL